LTNPLFFSESISASLLFPNRLSNKLIALTNGGGALIGFLAGAGIASARELSPTFFEGRKYTLFFISAGYHIVSLTVMGAIIAFFIK